jgi:hypothetical protein
MCSQLHFFFTPTASVGCLLPVREPDKAVKESKDIVKTLIEPIQSYPKQIEAEAHHLAQMGHMLTP